MATRCWGLLGSKQYNIPLYFRTVAGQNVTAGPYQVLLTFSINYNVCSVGILGALYYAANGDGDDKYFA